MDGVDVDIIPVRHLHDVAQVHHADTVADVTDYRQVVGDEQVGKVEFILKVFQEVNDLGLNGHVQSGDRLVGNDKLGAHRQCPGHSDSLPLPAAKLVGEPVRHVWVQTDIL